MDDKPIDLEKITKAVYSFLDKEGFMFEQMADWDRFKDASKPYSGIMVEDVYESGEGYRVNIGSTWWPTGYDWRPRSFTTLHTNTNRNGILIERDSMFVGMTLENHFIIKKYKIQEIMLHYLSKEARNKKE